MEELHRELLIPHVVDDFEEGDWLHSFPGKEGTFVQAKVIEVKEWGLTIELHPYSWVKKKIGMASFRLFTPDERRWYKSLQLRYVDTGSIISHMPIEVMSTDERPVRKYAMVTSYIPGEELTFIPEGAAPENSITYRDGGREPLEVLMHGWMLEE